MKIGLSLSGVNTSIKNLEEAGIVIPKDFNAELIEWGRKLRDKAKEILARESQQRTGQRYWTGRLQESIEMTITKEWKWKAGDSMSISVGPDMRAVPYAEWVEIGHYTESGTRFGGEWWPGYFYMSGAYVELGPGIPSEIAKTLKVSLTHFGTTASGRFKHLKTGKFVPGVAIS